VVIDALQARAINALSSPLTKSRQRNTREGRADVLALEERVIRRKVSRHIAWLAWLGRAIPLLLIPTLLATAARAQEARKVHLETIQFKSKLIGKVLPYSALLPSGYFKSNRRYPVLYLLHGLFGRHDDWITRTNLAEYAARYELIIVTPEGHDSWYVDSATIPTDKYESYFLRELIPDVDARYRTIKDRLARGVAGLSMGGYGALKYGLKHRDHFAFAGSLSGALYPANRTDERPGLAWDILRPSIVAAFGPRNSPTRQANDLHQIARNLTASHVSSLPYLYFDCGLEDGFLATNRELADILLAQKIPHQYRQLPGGHDWGYWDRQVREILRLYADLTTTGGTLNRPRVVRAIG
jgi:S-formylglutathione hydrolase FrmB